MRLLSLICFTLLFISPAISQTTTNTDTTIYMALEDMPRFPGCEQYDTTVVVKRQCAQRIMLAYIYQNINYPVEARSEGIEGKVVTTFVVEKDGTISNTEILKDIGGGCGDETLRVLNQMNTHGVRWIPGQKDGQAVRVRMTIPITFKLEELPPFVMMGTDSVWIQFDTPLTFEGGDEALVKHLNDNLKYPTAYKDSCAIGNIDVQLLVDRSGAVRVLDMTDYSALGFDFWFEATNTVTSTFGKWQVGTYEGKSVPAAYEVSVTFVPESPACQNTVDNFNRANQLAAEGVQLFNEEKGEEALTKFDEAINLFAGNGYFHYLRGQVYLGMKRYAEACSDLTLARDIAQLKDFDTILSVICK